MPLDRPPDETELVSRALTGDAEAQRRLYDELNPTIRATARRCRVGLSMRGVPIPVETEDDAVSAVWVVLLSKALQHFRGGSLRAFARQVAVYRSKEYFTRPRTGWFGIQQDREDSETGSTHLADHPDPALGPDDRMMAPNLREKLKSTLTDREWTCFTLWVEHGLTPMEIAEVMGITAINVRVTLHVCRKKLRQLLDPDGTGEGEL